MIQDFHRETIMDFKEYKEVEDKEENLLKTEGRNPSL